MLRLCIRSEGLQTEGPAFRPSGAPPVSSKAGDGHGLCQIKGAVLADKAGLILQVWSNHWYFLEKIKPCKKPIVIISHLMMPVEVALPFGL